VEGFGRRPSFARRVGALTYIKQSNYFATIFATQLDSTRQNKVV